MAQTPGRATVRRMRDAPFAFAGFLDRPLLRVVTASLFLVAILGLAGCDRNIEPYQPGEKSRPPDLARIFPGPPDGPGASDMAQADSGIPDRSALPPSRAEASALIREPGGAAIEGRIELAPGLARPDTGVLFVIARPQGVAGGPPLAVLRIANPTFPLEFSIGPEQVMIPSLRFEGAISISARLDADGNAMTRGSEDISSQVEEPLAPGATGVKLVLSERG